MGQMIGWVCGSCNAQEFFHTGGGMLSFNDSEVVELAKSGSLGPAMRALIGGGIPEGWVVFRENAYYQCPECGGILEGEIVRIDDSSGNWLMFHRAPGGCPKCGKELEFWDDEVPLSDDELSARCMAFAQEGCPECGEKSVDIWHGHCD